jgi:sugar lactone lactonase YvrE
MGRLRSVAISVAITGLVAAGTVPAAQAQGDDHRFPHQIDLPNGFRPEGITTGRGTTVYVGSLADGAIWKGDVRKGAGEVVIPGAPGRVAVGMDYERRRDRLWVVGGPTGTITVYDARRLTALRTYTVDDAGFLNDVAVTRRAVYVTDSMHQHLVVIPLGRNGSLPDPSAVRLLPLTGDFQLVPDQFNANGIVATPGARWLIIVQSVTSTLFRVDPSTGATRAIALTGGTLTGGDGLELRGRTLFVVRGAPNAVVPVRLRRHVLTGRVRPAITDPDLDVPSTATLAAGRLWVVNARFTTPPAPDTPYWITRLPAHSGRHH